MLGKSHSRLLISVVGMNAHINHDLALALLATDSESTWFLRRRLCRGAGDLDRHGH